MTFEPAEQSNLAVGLQILFVFIVPVILIYSIRAVVTPKPIAAKPPKPPNMPVVYKFRPRYLKYCRKHLTNIPKGRIALVVESPICDLCKKGVV